MATLTCPHCNFPARTKRGLTQHINKTPHCLDKQKASLGIRVAGNQKPPPPPAKRPLGFDEGNCARYKPRSGPWVALKAAKQADLPPCPPQKAARTPTHSSPSKKSISRALSPKELAFIEKQINAYPDTDAELWKLIEQDVTRSPGVAGGASHESCVMDPKMPASSQNNDGIAEDDLSLLQEDDDNDNTLDDNSSSNENPADALAQGYPLNEHVLPGEEDFNNDGYLNVGVNTELRQAFRDYCDKADDNSFPELTEYQARGIRLLDMMKRKRTSLDTYDEIMLWHYRENGVLDEFESLKDVPGHVSRDSLLATLKNRYHMEGKFPTTKTVTLPYSQAKVDLVCHDAWGCFESLLTDPRLTDDDFLFFDNNPFADPPENLPVISDLNTGQAFREAHRLYKKKANHIPLPVTLYMDGANTGQMKNMPITAVKMSLGIFTRTYRDLDHAWQVLGHVPHISKNQAKANKIMKQSQHIDAGIVPDSDTNDNKTPYDKSGTPKDLHKMLDIILESFREVQKKGFLWDLRYRGKTYEVEFIPYVIFMKCDTQEGDFLCGSYTSRVNVSQLCRYCTCPFEDTDNPQARWPYKTVPMVKAYTEAGDLDALNELSQHCIDNAFYKIRFSPVNNRGIHGATLSEMLHAILLGTFPMIRDVMYSQVGPDSEYARQFDHLAMLFGMQFGRQSERDMPKCKFSSGIREGKLNAKEYRGILLVMAAVLRCTRGRKLLRTKFSKQWVDDWLELVEILLCWEAFLGQSEMTAHHVSRLSFKNRFIMWMIKRVAPKDWGMLLKLMKFHAIAHMGSDIFLMGVPLEVDTGSNESGHKATKVAARTTQKNQKTFDFQTAKRLDEFRVVDMGMEELAGRKVWKYLEKPERTLPDPPQPPDKIFTHGTKINILEKLKDGRPCFSFGEGPKAAVPLTTNWDRDILDFLYDFQTKLKGWLKPDSMLCIRGEHTRNGVTFRGHPRYRDAHWRDWALFDWATDKEAPAEPVHIWCFVVLNGLPLTAKERKKKKMIHGNCHLDNGVYAVVECASFVLGNDSVPKSRLYTPIVKELAVDGRHSASRKRRFYLADTEAIVEPLYVIPDIGCENGCSYFSVKSRYEWILEMERFLDEPYPERYLNDKEGWKLPYHKPKPPKAK